MKPKLKSFSLEIESCSVESGAKILYAINKYASESDYYVRNRKIGSQNSKIQDEAVSRVETGIPPPKRRKVGDKNARRKVSDEDLEYWNFYLPCSEVYQTKPSVHTNTNIVDDLKGNLTPGQLDMFQKTCFGHFLELPNFVVQNQLIHYLLRREVYQPNMDEMWFVVNGVKLRFGLGEFALIVGLKCTGNEERSIDPGYANNLIDKYFSGNPLVTKESIIDCFKRNRWMSDEDAVKIAILYLLNTFLFSMLAQKYVDNDCLDIVDRGEFNSYPWGKVLYKATIDGMKDKLRTKPKSYRLGGFPLALQYWFYECCPYADRLLATQIEDKYPRILKWKITDQPRAEDLKTQLFSISKSKLNLSNIYPSALEKERFDITNLFKEEQQMEVADGSNCDADFTTPPPGTPNKVDWSVDIKRLFDQQAELKKELTSLKDFVMSILADVFKAIESLSTNKEVSTPIQHNNDGNVNNVKEGGTGFNVMPHSQNRVEHNQLPDKEVDVGIREGSRHVDSEEGGETIEMPNPNYGGNVKDMSDQLSHGGTMKSINVGVDEVDDVEKIVALVVERQLTDVPETQIGLMTKEVPTKSTPIKKKRTRRPAPVHQSSYVTDFTSSDSNCEASSRLQIIKGKTPFEPQLQRKLPFKGGYRIR